MVLDEGEGILPGDLEQIFDKFYRAKRAGQMRAGMGLGLTISRGFIEAMHGTITAANRTDWQWSGIQHSTSNLPATFVMHMYP